MMHTPHTLSGLIAWILSLLAAAAAILPYLETGMRIAALLLSMAASWFAIKYYRAKNAAPKT